MDGNARDNGLSYRRNRRNRREYPFAVVLSPAVSLIENVSPGITIEPSIVSASNWMFVTLL